MYSFVTRAEAKPARDLCREFMEKGKTALKRSIGREPAVNVVGSAKGQFITRNGNGPFDIDINLVFRDIDIQPQLLKKQVRLTLDAVAVPMGFSHGQNSTSAITYLHKKGGFSIDIGVLRKRSLECCERLIFHKNTGCYVWEKSIDPQKLNRKLMQIKSIGATNALKERYLRDKNMHLKRGEDIPSYAILAEAANEVLQNLTRR